MSNGAMALASLGHRAEGPAPATIGGPSAPRARLAALASQSALTEEVSHG